MRPSRLIRFPRPARRFDPSAPVIGRLGPLVTRLARSKEELRAAQALRYRVFYEELSAIPSATARFLKRDKDRFDRHCDHLLVIDTSLPAPGIVGTYRLLLDRHARDAGGFYSQSEFDLSPLTSANSGRNMLELGRSCILPKYRSKRTMELLWHGIWAYCLRNNVDIMFGCASFAGTSLQDHAAALGWLSRTARLDRIEDCPVNTPAGVDLAALEDAPCDERRIVAALPPLLKGYLRVGARIGSHAFVDRQFNTIDVLVVLKVSDIHPRYVSHYGADASRFAA